MKAYKNYSAARDAAQGEPIIRVGDLFLVGKIDQLTSIELVTPKGIVGGHVTAGHLDRLGNANWAKPDRGITSPPRIWE